MKLAVVLAAAVVAAAAVAAASPAAAAEVIEGIYTYNQQGVSATWTITPLCVPVVGDGRVPLELPVGCKLQIHSSAANTGAFQLTDGNWTYSTTRPGGVICSDGSSAPSVETFSFDDSLTGTFSSAHNAVCGLQPAINRFPFTLTYVSPLPNPVTRYPLNCQDNPQHLCS